MTNFQWNKQLPINEYAKLADQFMPTNFTPASWAALAKAAGMQYLALTSRHHDGFALFDMSFLTHRSTSVVERRQVQMPTGLVPADARPALEPSLKREIVTLQAPLKHRVCQHALPARYTQ